MVVLNKQVFEKDPLQVTLLNNGVAQISDDGEALDVLRFELQTFVCRGEYESGLVRILDVFLDKLRNGSPQPCGWISGFYGSGKSHLSKMLKTLWADLRFPDGASARSLIHSLPVSVADLLTELHAEAKKAGGAHAAAGTLGAAAGDNVRLALLGVVFRSVGLPAQAHLARFVLWLREQGFYEQVKRHVEAAGRRMEEELRHLHVSPVIAEALLRADSSYGDIKSVRQLLMESFRQVKDVDNDELVADLKRALTVGSKFPLTLVVLDETQQYIGNDEARAYQVQEVAELCQQRFGGRLLLVATGQAAMGSTPMLEKLKGRFPLTVALGDKDVEEVVRETILAKSVKYKPELKAALDHAIGEISRHLEGTAIAHKTEDEEVLVADYPILPVRRRFWERVLRATDVSGTVSQLRNQLRIVYEAVRATAEQPLGHVVPADFIFDQLREHFILSSQIAREVYDEILRLDSGSARDRLKARLLKVIFLVNTLPTEPGADIGVRATVGTLADLMVAELQGGSAQLRKDIPALLEELTHAALVMSMEAEGQTVYRLQTVESGQWYAEFRAKELGLRQNTKLVEQKRVELIKSELQGVFAKVKLTQGSLKEARKLVPTYDSNLPPDHTEKLYAWVLDGWNIDEKHVMASAKSVGLEDPTLFVFVPAREKSDLISALVTKEAAEQTLDARGGAPATPEGQDAKKMMELKAQQAWQQIQTVLANAFDEAKVFCGGGAEVEAGDTLAERLQAGGEQVMTRLYKHFDKADVADKSLWTKVIDKARQGSTDALAVLGYKGDVDRHPVCDEILRFLGTTGKKGAEIQEKFESPTYGWPRDAIQGGLYALLAANYVKAKGASGNPLEARTLERQQVTQAVFAAEHVKLTTPQLLAIRGVLGKLGITCSQDELVARAPEAVWKLRELREAAGGEPPLPVRLAGELIEGLEARSGNDLLLEIFKRKADIEQAEKEWKLLGNTIAARRPGWDSVLELLANAKTLQGVEPLAAKVADIEAQRALLDNPNPVPPIAHALTELLRSALNHLVAEYAHIYHSEMESLEADADWQKLDATKRPALLAELGLALVPTVDTSSAEAILRALSDCSFERWAERIDALPAKCDQVRKKVAAALQIKPVEVRLTKKLLRSETEVRVWLKEAEEKLLAALAQGPVQV